MVFNCSVSKEVESESEGAVKGWSEAAGCGDERSSARAVADWVALDASVAGASNCGDGKGSCGCDFSVGVEGCGFECCVVPNLGGTGGLSILVRAVPFLNGVWL